MLAKILMIILVSCYKNIENLKVMQKGINDDLIYAVENHNKQKIEELLSKGADINYKKPTSGATPLIIASEKGYLEIIQYLLDKNADCKEKDNFKKSAIIRLCSNYKKVNFSSFKGFSPFYSGKSKSKAYLSVIKLFITKGADVNDKDGKNHTLLMYACSNLPFDIIKYLVKNNAKTNAIDDEGNTPLKVAAHSKRASNIVKFLKENGIKNSLEIDYLKNKNASYSKIVEIENRTHYSSSNYLTKMKTQVIKSNIFSLDHIEISNENKYQEEQLKLGIQEDEKSRIKEAIIKKGLYELKKLLENFELINYRNNNEDKSFVIVAAQAEYEEGIEILIEKGFSIDEKDNKDRTALFYAIKRNNLKMLNLLMKLGASLVLRDKNGNSPLMFALVNGCPNDILEGLIRHEKIEKIINLENNSKLTPLHIICQKGNSKILSLFLKIKGIYLNPKNIVGNTPLHIACKLSKNKVIDLLLEAGADFEIKNYVNLTPLKLISEGNTQAIDSFKKRGIKVIKTLESLRKFIEDVNTK